MSDRDPADRESGPKTDAYTPIFDTGELPTPEGPEPEPEATTTPEVEPSTSGVVDAPPSEPGPMPVASITVPGRYHYLRWWQFVLMIIAAWIPAVAIGPGLFFWWTQDNSKHKTAVVFVVLVYVVVCIVGGLMLAMVPDKPLISALAIGVMSAVFASAVATAPFYGTFYCDHTTRHCLMGVVPY